MADPWIKNWDQRSADEWRTVQVARLREYLRYQVLPFSPYYGRVLKEAGVDADSIRSFDDLQKIPFTSKDSIAPTAEEPQKPRELVLQPTPELIRQHWPLSRKLALVAKKAFCGDGSD